MVYPLKRSLPQALAGFEETLRAIQKHPQVDGVGQVERVKQKKMFTEINICKTVKQINEVEVEVEETAQQVLVNV